MSRHLLDTNIISNATKPSPSEALVLWMAGQADDDLFISSLTVAEIRRGILEKPAGRSAESWSVGFRGPKARKRCSQAEYSRSTKRRDWCGRG